MGGMASGRGRHRVLGISLPLCVLRCREKRGLPTTVHSFTHPSLPHSQVFQRVYNTPSPALGTGKAVMDEPDKVPALLKCIVP